MQRHGFDGNIDLYQTKTKENEMLLLYSPDNNTGCFHLHTGKICMKEPKSVNCKLSLDFINDSQDTYVNGGWNHVDSGLGGNAVDHIKRLGKFDPTYKWILQKYGLDPYLDTFDESNAYNYDVQVVESSAIPEGITVVEVETKPVANEMTFNKGPILS